MLSLARATVQAASAGESLPTVLARFDERDVRFRRGQVALIASAPGVGKSALALRIALGNPGERIPTLYVSADSDPFTMRTRAAAMLTGHSLARVTEAFEKGGVTYYDERLRDVRNVSFTFDPGPSTDDLDEEVQAFGVVYGIYPHLLVVDNLANLYTDGEGGIPALERALDYLHELARKAGTAVLCLHHLTGEYDDGDKPPPQSALRGKISKVPELILGLYRPAVGEMGVTVVKNRGGPADPSGHMHLALEWAPDRMHLS